MKIILNTLILILIQGLSTSYCQILNPGFEDWEYVQPTNADTLWKPKNWIVESLSGDYATRDLKIKTGKSSIIIYTYIAGVVGTSIITAMANGKNENSFFMSIARGRAKGTPINIKPKIFGGKFNFYNLNVPLQSDTAAVRIVLKKFNPNTNKSDTICMQTELIYLTPDSTKLYPFSIPIRYKQDLPTTTIPDTVLIIFATNKRFFSPSGVRFSFGEKKVSQLIVDDIYLKEDELGVDIIGSHSSTLTLYPNPTNALLQITTSLQIAKLVVYQSNGTKVLESKAIENLDVSVLPEGLYLLEAWDMEGRRVLKKFEKR